MQNPRIQALVKALLIFGTAFFLFGRIANGTLTYYINERFVGFTVFGVIGLLVVGLAYHLQRTPPETNAAHLAHDHGPHHEHDPDHSPDHSHGLSWGGALLVALPVVLGLAVPPQPLGVAALDNRELTMSLERSALPASVQNAAAKAAGERTILDWWYTFQASDDYTALVGQEVKAVGFVYHDPRYGGEHFVLTRFVVSCCVADAAVVALVVRTPHAAALLEDQWVEVHGHFAASDLAEWQPPVLVAAQITPVDVPDQPYLYP